MKTFCLLASLCAFVGFTQPEGLEGPLDVLTGVSLEPFSPEDSGPWYFGHYNFLYVPLPVMPHYKVDTDLIVLPNGKQLDWIAHIGDGKVAGRILDTPEQRYSICQLDTAASDPISTGVMDAILVFCGKLLSLRRISENEVLALVFCPAGAHTLTFTKTKPGLMSSLLPF